LNALLHPPRPRLTVRIGVTGHRPDKLTDADVPALRDRVSRLLQTARQAALEVAADRTAGYLDAPPVLRVVSALAEGTDRLVADCGLALGFELHAVLPYGPDVYADEFADDRSRAEFRELLARASAVLVLDGTPQSGDAYETAGITILHHSDVLITVWDRASAAGRGGTGHVVHQAASQEILVAWVSSRSPHEAAVLHLEGDDFSTHPVAELGPALTALLRPPTSVPVRGRERRVADLRERFLSEPAARGWLGHAYGIITNLLTRPTKLWPRLLPRDYVASTQVAWRASWRTVSERLTAALEAALLAPYAWADQLATYYANRYRSAFTWTYLLAPLAIVGAFAAEHDPARERYWLLGNAAIVVLLLVIYFVGRRGQWHQRWLDYRSLAEQLRHLTILLPLGRADPSLRVPAHEASGDPRATWVHWYVRAIARQAGLVPAVMDAPYLAACRDLVRTELTHQAAYHAALAERMRAVHSRLHRVVVVFFAGALAAGAARLSGLYPIMTTSLTALLPALGGATHGFLSQGDFQSLARRSEGVRAGLERLIARLDRVRAPSSRALAGIADAAIDLMGSELIDWRVEVGEKPLSLPQTH
jgi:hypothetical protein